VNPPGSSRVRRTITGYVAVTVVGALALALILIRGSALDPAPEIARTLDTGQLAACLGEQVAVVQSGTFVDLHLPGLGGPDSVDGELGLRMVRGRLGTSGEPGRFEGACRDGTPLILDAVATEGGGLAGTVLGAGAGGTFVMRPAVAATLGVPSGGPLEGGELVARMFLAVAVVIAAARLVGAAFARIRQPQVIGEIIAGIMLGPSLLGLLAPGVTDYLFSPQVVDVMRIMAQFGLILFMFLIGLELDQSLLRGSGQTTVFVSHVSIIAPLVLGAALALPLYPLVGSGRFNGFALFLGAAMAITAFPVLARILTDTHLHTTRLGTLAITCAAVDDVTAWCVLAVVVGIANAAGPASAIVTIGLAIAFIGFMIIVVRPLLRRLDWVHARRGRLGAHLTAALLVGLLLSAWTTEVIGIHAIFGAFLAGAILPRSGDLARELTDRLEDLTVLFLLPIFFAVVGLSTSIGLLDRPVHWVIAGAVLAVAVVGKWAGGMLAARMAGERWREANALGILMNTRGLAEIVILTVGRELGVISPTLFTAMVLMAITTTLMTTPLLAIAYPRRIFEQEIAATEAALRSGRADHTVIVAIGDPGSGGELVGIARKLVEGGGRTEIVLTRIVELRGDEHVRASLASAEEAESAARIEVAPLVAELLGDGLRVTVHVEVGLDPGREIVRVASRTRANLIVLGMHRSVFGLRAFGGVVGDVLEGSAARVAVLVGYAAGGVERTGSGEGPVVLVGGGADERPAEDAARRVAASEGAPLVVLDAVGPRQLLDDARLAVIGYDGRSPVERGRRDAVVGDGTSPVLVVRGGTDDRTASRHTSGKPSSVDTPG
jgi:Kef-type K+ transport system membrane component KefB